MFSAIRLIASSAIQQNSAAFWKGPAPSAIWKFLPNLGQKRDLRVLGKSETYAKQKTFPGTGKKAEPKLKCKSALSSGLFKHDRRGERKAQLKHRQDKKAEQKADPKIVSLSTDQKVTSSIGSKSVSQQTEPENQVQAEKMPDVKYVGLKQDRNQKTEQISQSRTDEKIKPSLEQKPLQVTEQVTGGLFLQGISSMNDAKSSFKAKDREQSSDLGADTNPDSGAENNIEPKASLKTEQKLLLSVEPKSRSWAEQKAFSNIEQDVGSSAADQKFLSWAAQKAKASAEQKATHWAEQKPEQKAVQRSPNRLPLTIEQKFPPLGELELKPVPQIGLGPKSQKPEIKASQERRILQRKIIKAAQEAAQAKNEPNTQQKTNQKSEPTVKLKQNRGAQSSIEQLPNLGADIKFEEPKPSFQSHNKKSRRLILSQNNSLEKNFDGKQDKIINRQNFKPTPKVFQKAENKTETFGVVKTAAIMAQNAKLNAISKPEPETASKEKPIGDKKKTTKRSLLLPQLDVYFREIHYKK